MANISFITLYDKGCLGVRYLSSLLRKKGHSTSVIYLERHEGKLKNKKDVFTSDENLWIGVNEYGTDLIRSYSDPISEKDIDILLELLQRLKPDAVAFSLRSMFLDSAIQLTRHIRQRFNFPVIFGGIAATCEPEKCIQYSDIVCLGEGEQSMLEIAERIDTGRSFNDIDSLWIRHDGTIYKNRLYPLEQNLDRLPFPDYTAENKFWIFNSNLVEQDASIGNMSEYTYEIMTSRGCPFSCNYCCNSLYKEMYRGQRWLRRRSIENVIAELREAKDRYNIKSVLFRDEVFTSDWNWIKEFSQVYKREIALPFWCNTHPLFADARILNSLKDCGMYNVTMGIQSGSENILYNAYNRKTPVEKIVNAAAILEQLNLPIRPRYDIISNNPFEAKEDCRQTLELLMKLAKPVNFGITKLSFIPNTRLAVMAKNKSMNEEAKKLYRFWNNLYLLNQYRFFPNGLIRGLSKNRFLRNYPRLLQLLLTGKFVELKCQGLLKLIKARLPKGLVLFLKRVRYLLKRY
jgi:radical SAM superfamily enzyme YgiQ (UPF0313 family)